MMPVLASIVAKATIILVLGLTGAWLARRSRAAVRHALLAASFAVLVALPIASLIAPPLRITVARPARLASAAPRVYGVLPGGAQRTLGGAPPDSSRPAELSLSALLLIAWLGGAAIFLLPVATGLWQVRLLRRSAMAWPLGQAAAEKLALEAGIHRRIEVLLHEALPGPMTCGAAHPAIVLPTDVQNWTEEDLHRAMVHELEHVRRGDWVSHCLARIACAAYWFHPLVWLAWRQLALQAERCCDDAVLGRSEATAYADQLVGLARRLSASSKQPVLAMAARADLAARVNAVLDTRRRRGRAGRLAISLTCAAAALLLVAIAPLEVAATPQAPGLHVSNSMPMFAVSTMLVIADVQVSDLNGKAIEGLSAKDFAVTEDGVPQPVSVFEYQKLDDSGYYILGYYVSNNNFDDRFRRITITAKGYATAKFNYRSGYYPIPVPGVSVPVALTYSREPGVAFPILLSTAATEYSLEARRAKYQGPVTLDVEIDDSGDVTHVKVIRSLGLGLDEKAIDAVSKWKFKPGTKDARAVAMEAVVTVSFRVM